MEDVLVRILVNNLKYKRTGSNRIPLKFTLVISIHSILEQYCTDGRQILNYKSSMNNI